MFSMLQAPDNNQSIENAGVAFVKVASERNEFFQKIKKTSNVWQTS